jgi:hypothetical protein
MANLVRSVILQILGNNTGAKVSVDEAEAWADEIEARNPELSIGANIDDLEKVAAEAEELLAAISEAKASPQLGLDEGEFLGQLESAQAGLERLSAIVADPSVSLHDLVLAIAEIQEIRDDLIALGGIVSRPSVKLDAPAILAEIAAIKTAFDSLQDSLSINVGMEGLKELLVEIAAIRSAARIHLVIDDMAAVTAQMMTLRAAMDNPIGLSLGDEPLIMTQLASMEAAIEAIKASAKTVNFDFNLAPMIAQLAALRTAASEAFMGLDADASIAADGVEGLIADINKDINNNLVIGDMAAITAQMDVLRATMEKPDNLNVANEPVVLEQLATIETAVEAIKAAAKDADFDFDLAPMLAQLAEVKTAVSEAFMGLDADTKLAVHDVDDLMADINKDAKVNLVIGDMAAISAQMETLRAALEKPIDLNLEVEPSVIAELAATEAAIKAIQDSAKDIGFNANFAPLLTQLEDLKLIASQAFMGLDAGAADAGKSTSLLAASMNLADLAAAHLGGGFTTTEDGTRTLTGMVEAGSGAWGIFGGRVRLFGGALDSVLPHFLATASYIHIIADAIIEFGAVAIPAAIAFSAFAVTAGQGAIDIYDRMAAMENVTGALGVKVGILNGGFLKLQNAVEPGVFELFGDALEIINSKTGVFDKLVMSTETVVEDLALRITNAVTAAGGLGSVLAGHAVPDLQEFGSMLGNVFGILGNLLKSMPGVAEVILRVMEGLTGFAETVTGSSEPILKFIIAIHGIILWGGLAATAVMWLGSKIVGMYTPIVTGIIKLGQLGGAMLGLTEASGKFASVLAFFDALGMPLAALALLVGAIAAVGYESTQASAKAKSFVANMNASLANDNASQAIAGITNDFGQLNERIKETSASSELPTMDLWQKSSDQLRLSLTNLAFGFGHLSDGILGLKAIGAGISDLWDANGAAGLQAAKDTSIYKGEIYDLTGQQKNLLGVMGNLMQSTTTSSGAAEHYGAHISDLGGTFRETTKAGYTYAQALEIMDLAGIKNTDSASTMEGKIKGLITGYAAMGVAAGAAGNAVNAETFASEQSQSGISKLQQSMSTFLSTVTGGESAFLTFVTGIAPSTSGLKEVSVAASGGAASMTGLNTASLTLRQNFGEAITSAEGVYQALQLQAQASGGTAAATRELGSAGKDLVGTLYKQAGGSSAAQSMILALAQTVGYSGVMSYQALGKWLGNTTNSEKDLDKQTGLLTKSSANLATDTANLATAIGSTLSAAMATALFSVDGGQKTMDNFATAVHNANGDVAGMVPSAQKMYDQLLLTTGSASEAKDEFFTFAYQMHLTTHQANDLWDSIQRGGDTMDGTHGARAQFSSDIQDIINRVPGSETDINNLTTAIQKHGTTSSQYHSARTQLIDDLEHAGVNAHTATQLVDDLTGAVKKLPAHANVDITEHASGTFGVSMTSSSNPYPGGISGRSAKGWKIPGYGGGDSVHILAEPGETIVPKHLTPLIAPLMRLHGVPGFEKGGWVPEKTWEKEHPWKDTWIPAKTWDKEHPWKTYKSSWVPAKTWDKEHPYTPYTSSAKSTAFGSAGHSQGHGGATNPLSGIPGLAAGGLIMDASTSTPNLGPWTTSEYQDSVNAMTKNLENSLTQYQTSLYAGQYTGKFGAGVSQWGNDVVAALKMLGLSPGLAFAVLYQMQTESGGNPNSINLTDSNAAAGDPSRGLMQVIGTTFEAYAGPYGGYSIYNPMANIYAALNYAMHRYGPSLMSGGMGIGSGHGYSAGGMINEPVLGLGLHSGDRYAFAEHAPEMVVPMHAGARVSGGRGDTHIYHISVNGDTDPDAAARRIHQSLRDYRRKKGGQPLGLG